MALSSPVSVAKNYYHPRATAGPLPRAPSPLAPLSSARSRVTRRIIDSGDPGSVARFFAISIPGRVTVYRGRGSPKITRPANPDARRICNSDYGSRTRAAARPGGLCVPSYNKSITRVIPRAASTGRYLFLERRRNAASLHRVRYPV